MREIFTLSWLGFSETYWWLPKISDNFLKTSEHCQSLVNAGHLLGFIPVEKACGKTFRIMRFDRRKCGKVVKKDLHKNFGVKFMFFCFCSLFGLLDWIVLVLVWFERSLPPSQVRWQSCPWHITSGGRDVDLLGQLWAAPGWMGYNSHKVMCAFLHLIHLKQNVKTELQGWFKKCHL